jgi:P-type Mg2+ transporter
MDDARTRVRAPNPARPFWSAPVSSLFAQLESSAAGLTGAAAAQRLARFGPNAQRAPRDGRWVGLLWNQFKSPLVLLLLFAMGLSLLLGETVDALIVLTVVLGSALLGFSQEYRAGNAVARLLDVIKLRTTVLRDGAECEVPVEDIVPGDVVLLSAGAAVPADCALLDEQSLFVDEAALSGESYPAEKHAGVRAPEAVLSQRDNALFQGTHVVSGTARALVVHTGAATEFGAIANRLQAAAPQTEFERGIHRFGDSLVKITLVLVIVIFGANIYFHKPAVDSFLFALALAVGLTPELLPVIVSVTLARGAQRMARRKVIVKRLAAIENLGSMDVLCSDKTGTLTEGRMALKAAVDARGDSSQQVLLYAHLNASFETGFVNPIDRTLRDLAGFEHERAAYRKLGEIPYDFVRKRLSIAVEHAPDGERWLITKGAVDNMLAACVDVQLDAQNRVPVDAAREQVLQALEHHSRAGLRVLAVAVRSLPADAAPTRADETGLTLLGLLLFEDPTKPDIGDTMRELSGLGVSLKLVTGDNRYVSAAVMRGIGTADPIMLTGGELHALSDAALLRRVGSVQVFAEVEPNQKERILLALRKAGHVVGYIGDGINDASALHAADVGISVEGAVDVAKAAADIVLLEHTLDVLVQGVRDGRATFANTLKYIFITTSANFGNMLSMAAASVWLPFLPLLAKQILLNNFLSDLPSLTIATDSVDHELLERPRRWNIAFIRNFMVAFGLVSSAFDLITFGALLLLMRANEAQFQTGWFIESLMTELFIVLIIRTRRPAWRSRPGKLLSVTTLVVASVAVFLPYTPIAPLFGFVPLPPLYLAVLLAITVAYLLASDATKRWFYARFEA